MDKSFSTRAGRFADNAAALTRRALYDLGCAETRLMAVENWFVNEWKENKTYKGNLNSLRIILGMSEGELNDIED